MDWLNSYDLISPTNPIAATFFGILATIVITIIIWFETKEKKTTIFALLAGSSIVLLLVFILKAFGFY